MRALIIGCGYVGTTLGTRLTRQGMEVFGLRRSPDSANELQTYGIQPLVADITRPGDLALLPGPFDWVINTAAAGGGGTAAYQQVYLEGTRHILQWLQSNPPQKYVYTSSTGVYAQNDGSWVDETSVTEPDSPTARVLVETEKLLLNAFKTTGFPAIILRVAGIYGPGRGYFFKQFINNEARLEGEGQRVMNMIHRADVAGAIVAALQNGKPGEIYNVVDDEPVTQKAFYEYLAATLKRPLPPASPPGPILPSQTR